MTPVFRWNGSYVGFLENGWFFQSNARYLGWVEKDGTVWRSDGGPLGDLVDGHYILRDVRRTSPVPKTPKGPPVPPEPPLNPGTRIPRIPRPGWIDALEGIGRLPSSNELSGCWSDENGVLAFSQDGRYTWSEGPRVVGGGTWELIDLFLVVKDGDGGPGGQVRRYGIIEFTGDTLMLRWITDQARTLPFTLRRM